MAFSIKKVKKSFLSLIRSLSPTDVAKDPKKDFSRKRKCSLFDTVLLLLTMAGHSLTTEMDNYFLLQGKKLPSKSAFIQQRSKLSSDALYFVFSRFNQLFPFTKTLFGLHILACDGSDVNIPSQPDDEDSFVPYNSGNGGYYQKHLHALFDPLEKRYADAILSSKRKTGENRAFCSMIDRNTISGKILYLADRGYACFNTIAHIIQAGQFYLIRAKDPSSSGSFLHGIPFPSCDEFDIDHTFIISRRKILKHQDNTSYKKINSGQYFDFIDPKDKETVYPIKLRIIRLKIGDGSYEYLISNLPRERFHLQEFKCLYHLRWSIETSFRQLKHTLALNYFHSIKREFIEQEVFARLTMFNFISLTIGTVDVKKSEDLKYEYMVSFSESVNICRKCLLGRIGPIKLKALLLQRLIPKRPERSFPRNIRSQRLRTLNNRA